MADGYAEDTLLPISALQHLLFCERQCALIHVEQQWTENRLTAEGRLLHRKAHDGPSGTRDGVRIVRGLRLRSLRFGLVGQADIVEFRKGAPGKGPERPFPVEYKRGRAKRHRADEVQLCAQALCLEEMLGVIVPVGALYYGATRSRRAVTFDAELRALTESTCRRLHELIVSEHTPAAVREKKCDGCSLIETCMPDVLGATHKASRYVNRALAASLGTLDVGAGP